MTNKTSLEYKGKLLASALSSELTNEISKNQSKFKIAGFRKGKVPADVIKQSVGSDMLFDVANQMAKKDFINHAETNKLKVIGIPRITITSPIVAGVDIDFTAVYEEYPTIKMPDLSKLTIELHTSKIEPVDIESALEKLKFRHASWQEADVAGAKDKVVIDFVGKVDGEAFAGGSATNYNIELGMKKMLPAFESGIVGMKVGEEKTFPVKFPEDYQATDLAGKTADFTIKLHKVEQAVLPASDDAEFLKKINAQDEADLLSRLEKSLNADLIKMTKQIKEHRMVELLNKNVEFELPVQLVQDEAFQARENAIKQYGNNTKFKMKAEDLPLELFVPDVENRIKISLIVGNLIEQEKLDASEADVDAFLKKTQGEHYERAKSYYDSNPQQKQALKSSVVEEKVFDYLFSKIKVKELAVSFDEMMSLGH